MAASKHIGKIGLVICLVMLLITGLFMNGETLGITPVGNDETEDRPFTANDRNGDWDPAGAVTVTLNGDSASVSGGGAYAKGGDVHILCAGTYVLSGELTGGSVIVEASNTDKIWILLDGASLYCEDSAAFLVEQAGKVFLTLAGGTENTIASGAKYREESVSTGIDGAIYSRDDLTINGSGSLRVMAEYQHGIVCNDDLVITGGTLDVTAPQDGVHANDSVRFADAALTINAGDDGITVSNDEETSYIYVESGSITIPACYEGMEAIEVDIAGGTLDIRPTDDGINANGWGSGSIIRVSGGDITIINETGRDADGLDSNGDIEISGGNLLISVNGTGTNAAIDYGSESGGTCTISGGTVIAAGSSTMAEGFDSASEQCFIMYAANAPAGTTVALKNQEGNVLLSQTIPCAFTSIVLSTSELQMGETCTISIGDSEEEVVVDNSTTSGGFGMGGMGGMGGGFGGRGEKSKQFSGGQQNAGNTGSLENTPLNVATMSAENSPPEIPEGEGGGMRGMPGVQDGDGPRGGMGGQEPPDGGPQGGFGPGGQGGEMPDGQEPPDGGTPPDGFDPGAGGDGNMPDAQAPDNKDGDAPQDGSESGGAQNSEMPEASEKPDDQTRGQIEMGGGRFQQWQAQDGNQGGFQEAAPEDSNLSPETLIPVGISALFLLLGIIVATKVKH